MATAHKIFVVGMLCICLVLYVQWGVQLHKNHILYQRIIEQQHQIEASPRIDPRFDQGVVRDATVMVCKKPTCSEPQTEALR